jgi:hypothetical protein
MRGLRSWTTTVQALRATMAIYHIRYLFAYGHWPVDVPDRAVGFQC